MAQPSGFSWPSVGGSAGGIMCNSTERKRMTDYVCGQWRELINEFQRCCADFEPFDVNAWVEQNVNREAVASQSQSRRRRLTKPQIVEAQRVLICRFNASKLGVDIFWGRDYCKRYQYVLDTLPIERVSLAETLAAAAQEASLVAMDASPLDESDCNPPPPGPVDAADPVTPPHQPADPAGTGVALPLAYRAVQDFLHWMEQEEGRHQAWMRLVSDVVQILAGQLIGPDAFTMQRCGSLAAFDWDILLRLRLRSSARYCSEDVMMYIIIGLGGLKLQA